MAADDRLQCGGGPNQGLGLDVSGQLLRFGYLSHGAAMFRWPSERVKSHGSEKKKGPPLAERPRGSRSVSRSAMPAELLRLARRLLRDHDVDERRALEGRRLLQRVLQILWILDEPALAAERLHHLVVARAVDQRVGLEVLERVVRVLRVSGADAAVVEDDDLDRQVVAAGRLHLHAREA